MITEAFRTNPLPNCIKNYDKYFWFCCCFAFWNSFIHRKRILPCTITEQFQWLVITVHSGNIDQKSAPKESSSDRPESLVKTNSKHKLCCPGTFTCRSVHHRSSAELQVGSAYPVLFIIGLTPMSPTIHHYFTFLVTQFYKRLKTKRIDQQNSKTCPAKTIYWECRKKVIFLRLKPNYCSISPYTIPGH